MMFSPKLASQQEATRSVDDQSKEENEINPEPQPEEDQSNSKHYAKTMGCMHCCNW